MLVFWLLLCVCFLIMIVLVFGIVYSLPFLPLMLAATGVFFMEKWWFANKLFPLPLIFSGSHRFLCHWCLLSATGK